MAKKCSVRWTIGALCLAATMTACSQAAPPSQVLASRITPNYDARTRRLQCITYDRNGDGAIDAWTYMNATQVVRAEIDENFNHRVDRWEYYRAGAPEHRGAGMAAGALERVETSLGDDGVVTRHEWYESGAVVRADEDTDGDRHPDKWERWEKGSLVEVALDTQHHGRPDRRIIYGADGSSPRFEVDPDGSGHFRPTTASR
jgi:hypothetical protein